MADGNNLSDREYEELHRRGPRIGYWLGMLPTHLDIEALRMGPTLLLLRLAHLLLHHTQSTMYPRTLFHHMAMPIKPHLHLRMPLYPTTIPTRWRLHLQIQGMSPNLNILLNELVSISKAWNSHY